MDKNSNSTAIRVYEALKWASSFLQEHDYEAQIGERLLLHHTKWSRASLFAEYRSSLPEELWDKFQQDVERAANGYPVQYIIGEEDFYGRSFQVNEHVLIPRPETEELIEVVLKELNEFFQAGEFGEPLRIVDVGTGSGIIAITLKLEWEKAHVTAIDLSEDALNMARKNADRLQAKVDFIHGDLLTPLIATGKKANVIVSNPPYVREGERTIMKENVLHYEPELALFAGEDGLDVYRRLVKQIPDVMIRPGLVAFEIGHGQGEEVKSLLQEALNNWAKNLDVQVIKDINEKERIVIALVR